MRRISSMLDFVTFGMVRNWYGNLSEKSAPRKAFRWAYRVHGWEWYRNVAGDLLN